MMTAPDGTVPPPALQVCTADLPKEEENKAPKDWMVDGVATGKTGGHAHVVCSKCRAKCCQHHGHNCCLVRTG
jgi:hypothetical protein